MKKPLITVALVLLVLLALLTLAFGWLFARSEGWGERAAAAGTPLPAAAAGSADPVARGAYLARVGNCMACHTDRGGAAYAGGRAIDTPFGTLYGSNLTPARTGLAGWSSDDFWQALHHGRSRGGRLLYPAFPYPNYTQVNRADSDALFAFLQSLPPVERANRAHDLQWPVNTQIALRAWRALYFRPGTHQDDPGQGAEWNRGAYLVRGLGHCSACHATRNVLGASDLMDLSGGMIPMQSWYAPSLASDAEAGVAGWDLERIVQLLATGRTEQASTLGPMAEVILHSTQHVSQADLRAMAGFLKSLPPEPPTKVEPRVAAPGFKERGARLYGAHCAQCHGERGEGVPGAYPPLAGNRAVTMPVTSNLVQAVIYGGYPPSTQGNPRPFGMPPFALVLSDADVAAVLTYIRSSWGHAAGAVSELDVAQQRSPRQ